MGFFACYLLTPVSPPQRLRCTYVGFTVSPTRRIRQHNGELVNGAKRTTKHRPWEMIVVVHGFPSKFHALQFEYAWQHPYICRFTKERLLPLKGSKGLGHPRSVKRKLVELHEMLHVAPWASFPLTVTYTNLLIQNLVRTSSFFQWPVHMACEVRPLQEFVRCQAPASTTDTAIHSGVAIEKEDVDGDQRGRSMGDECCICDDALSLSGQQVLRCYNHECRAQYHALCLADHFLLEVSVSAEHEVSDSQLLRPEQGTCPECTGELLWPLLVRGATSNPVPIVTQAKRLKGRASKKRRPDDPNVAGCGSSVSCDGMQGAAVGVKSVNSSKAGMTESPAEVNTVDSDDNEDAGWFEDDVSAAEYWDRDERGTEASEPSESIADASVHLPWSHPEDTKPSMFVDLTTLDD